MVLHRLWEINPCLLFQEGPSKLVEYGGGDEECAIPTPQIQSPCKRASTLAKRGTQKEVLLEDTYATPGRRSPLKLARAPVLGLGGARIARHTPN
jgi:hypothetical protein